MCKAFVFTIMTILNFLSEETLFPLQNFTQVLYFWHLWRSKDSFLFGSVIYEISRRDKRSVFKLKRRRRKKGKDVWRPPDCGHGAVVLLQCPQVGAPNWFNWVPSSQLALLSVAFWSPFILKVKPKGWDSTLDEISATSFEPFKLLHPILQDF